MQRSVPAMASGVDAEPPAPTHSGALSTVAHLAFLAAAVLIYLLAIRVRTDLATGWVDSAIYHALFLDAQAVQSRFGDIYFLARWPWVLTGGVFYAIFPLAMASFMLTWVISWLYGAAFFLFLRQFVRPGAALGAAIIACCNLYITQTIASGYPSVAASFLLLAGGALSVAGNRRGSLWLIAFGGFTYGIAAMTHSFAVMIGFFLHAMLLGSRIGRMPWKTLLRNEVVLLIAALLVLPISVAALRLMGSSETVFQRVISTSQRAFQGQGAAFQKGHHLILQDTGGLIFLAAGVVAIVVSWLLAGRRWSAIPRPHRVVHLLHLVPLGAAALFDFGADGAILQYGFYQVFLLGGAFLQFGVLLDRVFARPENTMSGPLAVAVLTIAVVLATLGILDHAHPTATVFRVLIGVSIAATLVALLSSIARPLSAVARIAVPAFIVITAASSNFSRYSLMVPGQAKNGAPGLQAVDWAMGMANIHAGPQAPLFVAYDRGTLALGDPYPISNDRWYFFYQNQEYFFSIFDTLAGASLWDRGLVATTIDDFTTRELDNVLSYQGKAAVLVMWQGSETFERETWDQIQDRDLHEALASNPEFRHRFPLEIRDKLKAHGLYVGTAASGQYDRPGGTPFNYIVFEVVLPEPESQ